MLENFKFRKKNTYKHMVQCGLGKNTLNNQNKRYVRHIRKIKHRLE